LPPLEALIVLDKKVDPYRFDTPAGHRDGRWFGDQIRAIGLGDGQTVHLRGAHYAIAACGDVRRPDGLLYINDADCWDFVDGIASNCARWLSYVGFDQIADRRNAPPIIRLRGAKAPEPYVALDLEMMLPNLEDLRPRAAIAGFVGVQPYRLAIFGEKSSLEPVVDPIAEDYDADLFLCTGETSSTQVYLMCKAAAEDGRPLIVFTMADFDPAGHRMPVSIGRKIQALKDLFFSDLEYEVRPVSLLLEQVADLNLPSTPLKPTERRADRWRTAMDQEQTELDALSTVRPDVLREQLTSAMDEFYGHSLERRVREVRRDWQTRAQAILEAHLDSDRVERIRADAETKLANLQAEIETLNDAMRAELPDGVDLPAIEIRRARRPGTQASTDFRAPGHGSTRHVL
jgi:hypothetical protein